MRTPWSTHSHVLTTPEGLQGSPAAVAYPPGRRCPRGNRGLRSRLKLCWLLRDINSPLAAAGSFELGPGLHQAQTLALVGRTERGSLVHCPSSGSSCGFSPQPLLRPLQVRGAKRPGPGRGAVRGRVVGCLQEHRPRAPGCTPYCAVLQLAFSQGSPGLGLSKQPGLGDSPVSLWVLSQLSRRPWGGASRRPFVRMGSLYPERPGYSPGSMESQSCALGILCMQQSPKATGLSGEISAISIDLPSRGGAVGPWARSLEMPASSPLQGGGRKDVVLLAA